MRVQAKGGIRKWALQADVDEELRKEGLTRRNRSFKAPPSDGREGRMRLLAVQTGEGLVRATREESRGVPRRQSERDGWWGAMGIGGPEDVAMGAG